MTEDKRIVVVGYPSSGKTVLAAALKDSFRGRAGITVEDGGSLGVLADIAAGIKTTKRFPAATELVYAGADGKSEARAYDFSINFRDGKYKLHIQDYAGERVSNPEFSKEFVAAVGGVNAAGAVFLVNPGMELFNPAADEAELKKREMMPDVYCDIARRLCESGCRNFVVAVTASDRIRRGFLGIFGKGDLRRKENAARFASFKAALDKLRRYFKTLKTQDGRKVDFKIECVTATGPLKYDSEGRVEEARLAKGRQNTVANAFLWIIDPWRIRRRIWAKRLAKYLAIGALAALCIYAAARICTARNIENLLHEADDALGNFGDPSAQNFDLEKGSEKLETADSRLKAANEAWCLDESSKKLREEALLRNIGLLATNQVRLAHARVAKKCTASEWMDPTLELDGEDEFKSWPYWERLFESTAPAIAAAREYRDGEVRDLRKKVVLSNCNYLLQVQPDVLKRLDENEVLEFHARAILTLEALPQAEREPLLEKDTEVRNAWKAKAAKIADRPRREAEECANDIRQALNLQTAVDNLYGFLAQDSASPFRGTVLAAAADRANAVVEQMLKPNAVEARKKSFDDVYRAALKFKRFNELNLGEDVLGGNVLYHLAKTIPDGLGPNSSGKWLCYRFVCTGVWVATDHKTRNPGSEPFCREADANVEVALPEKRPLVFSHDWLIKNTNGEFDAKGKLDRTPIPGSSFTVDIPAAGEIEVRPLKWKEDWFRNRPFGACSPSPLQPGWGLSERKFFYPRDGEEYPNGVDYLIRLEGRVEGEEPVSVFSNALEKAKAWQKQ